MSKLSKILVYSEKRSNRLSYALSEIFTRRLGLNPIQTHSKEEFEAFDGIKINYAQQKLDTGIWIKPHGLIASKKVELVEFNTITGQLPRLTSEGSVESAFDPLATCFYFLSLYQEYMPHRTDEHGRFLASESIQQQYGATQLAFVDAYIAELAQHISKQYPHYSYQVPEAKTLVTVDVDQLFLFKAKGMARSTFALMKDAVTFSNKMKSRASVLFFGTPDPLDIYDKINTLCRQVGSKPIYFVQVGEQSRFDRNNPIHLPAVVQRINEIALDAQIGVHPSYYSSEEPDTLRNEVNRLRSICSNSLNMSRQHYMRWRLPHTLTALIELGINQDYSLGFADKNGFRAGTSFPFKFFDLMQDEVLDLTLHPTHFSDMVASRSFQNAAESQAQLHALKAECKKYGGEYCTMWHPEVLAGVEGHDSLWPVFENLMRDEKG